MLTFCFLAAQGGREPQLISHAAANIRLGNDQAFLIRAACEGAAFGPAMEVKFDSDGGSRRETPVQEIEDWIIQVKNLLKS